MSKPKSPEQQDADLHFTRSTSMSTLTRRGADGLYSNPHNPDIRLSASEIAALAWYVANASDIARHSIDAAGRVPETPAEELARLRAELAAIRSDQE